MNEKQDNVTINQNIVVKEKIKKIAPEIISTEGIINTILMIFIIAGFGILVGIIISPIFGMIVTGVGYAWLFYSVCGQ